MAGEPLWRFLLFVWLCIYAGIMVERHVLAPWFARRESRRLGTRRDGGSRKPSASIGTKEPGTPTRATATKAGCSFSPPPGDRSAGGATLTSQPRASSYTGLGWSTFVTVPHGGSGAPLGSAD